MVYNKSIYNYISQGKYSPSFAKLQLERFNSSSLVWLMKTLETTKLLYKINLSLFIKAPFYNDAVNSEELFLAYFERTKNSTKGVGSSSSKGRKPYLWSWMSEAYDAKHAL
jgi:hypothetical protein